MVSVQTAAVSVLSKQIYDLSEAILPFDRVQDLTVSINGDYVYTTDDDEHGLDNDIELVHYDGSSVQFAELRERKDDSHG